MVSFGCLLPTRGVVVQSEDRTELTSRVRTDVVELAGLAESLGYRSVWVGDSVLAKPRLEPLTTLAAVATATDTVELGTAVYLPALRHPVHVAHATATVDQLSGGRLSLGVGVGVRPAERREMEQLGVDYNRRGAIVNEGLTMVTELWGGESVTFDGAFHTIEDASIGFSPARDPDVYVASAAFDPETGFPRTVRERIRTHGDGWLPIAIDPERYRAGPDRVRGFVDDPGRRLIPAYYVDIVVDSSEEAALEEAREFLRGYYSDEQLGYADGDVFSAETIRQRGVFGPPKRVDERLDSFVEAGVERFVVRFTAADQRDQLRRFRDVVDAL